VRALLVAACLGLACAPAAETPEDRVRAVLAALEAGAQARDVGAMKELVSERYMDAAGHDKRAVGALVGLHLMRNESIHLLVRVASLAIPAPGRADVVALVAMAGTPIPGPEALPALRADLYRFDLALGEEDGVWRVTGAAWRPAAIADFQRASQ
jgi:hypothetical protein